MTPGDRRVMHVEKDALVDSLAAKREDLNEQARRHRDLRDRLNDQTKSHAQRRDELNGQVRGILEQANAHRAQRDERNRLVREAKARRDELNQEAHAKVEVLQGLRRESGGAQDGASIAKLRAEVRHLEYQQQTQALSPKKEKELIDLIAAKVRELKERESAMSESADLQRAYDEMKTAKAAAEEQHQRVTALANEAQVEHEAMVKLFSQADALRKEADAAQAEFVRSKVEADKVHHEYVRLVSDIRDLDRVQGVLRPSAAGPGAAATAEARAEADEIFDKFRKGEKLSTEDLMALQKAGRL